MAIIVEIKSNKTCCRESNVVLTEQEKNELDKVLDFVTGGGGGRVGESFRTLAARYVVDAILSRMVPELQGNKQLYTFLRNTIAAIDLDQWMGLLNPMSDGREASCESIAKVVVQGIEDTLVELVTKGIRDELRKMLPDPDTDSTFGQLFGDAIRLLLSGGALTTQLTAGALFTEDVKGSLTETITKFICEIEFGDVLKVTLGDFGNLIATGGKELGDAIKGFLGE
jgi:hypothetical protein